MEVVSPLLEPKRRGGCAAAVQEWSEPTVLRDRGDSPCEIFLGVVSWNDEVGEAGKERRARGGEMVIAAIRGEIDAKLLQAVSLKVIPG